MKTRLHKKQQNCNKLLTLFTMGIAMLTGVVAMGLSTIRESYHQTRAVSYDDNNCRITLNVDELNNYTFNNFNSALVDIYVEEGNDISYLEDAFLSYNNNSASLSPSYLNGYVSFFVSDANFGDISFNSNNDYRFLINNDNDFIYSLIIDFANIDNYYEDFKQAIEQDIVANQPDNMPTAFQEFVSIIVSGIGAFATGVASGVSDFASALFLKVENGAVVGLSVFGGIVAIFAGLALAVAITTKVYLWITSLGN